MREIRLLLAAVPPKTPRQHVVRFVHNTLVVAGWLRCETHFLAPAGESVTVEEAVSQFQHSHSDAPSALVKPWDGQAPGIFDMLEKNACDALVLLDSVLEHPTKGADERKLLERSTVPVFLLPREADYSAHPPSSILAPLSGEQRGSEAAAKGLALAKQTDSPIDFVHVIHPEKPSECEQSMEGLGDQLHHEYSYMVEKIVAEASPYSSPEELSHIRRFYHRSGFTNHEIASVLDQVPGALLVVEWKGSLAAGRAVTIKNLLKQTHHLVLFVKSALHEKSTLRIGKDLRRATSHAEKRSSHHE